MVCIYCGSPSLKVINSRSQKRLNQTWRRRQCQSCQAIFTSLEAIDYSRSVAVRSKNNAIEPFVREKLLISILKSCQYRKTALADAMALTDTVLQKITNNINGSVPAPRSLIAQLTLATLEHFDKAAAVQYEAYHRSTPPK